MSHVGNTTPPKSVNRETQIPDDWIIRSNAPLQRSVSRTGHSHFCMHPDRSNEPCCSSNRDCCVHLYWFPNVLAFIDFLMSQQGHSIDDFFAPVHFFESEIQSTQNWLNTLTRRSDSIASIQWLNWVAVQLVNFCFSFFSKVSCARVRQQRGWLYRIWRCSSRFFQKSALESFCTVNSVAVGRLGNSTRAIPAAGRTQSSVPLL